TLELFIDRANAESASAEPLDFILKLKKMADAQTLYDEFPRLAKSRVKVVADEPVHDLVLRSRAVIGFNTLPLIEALLGDTAVMLPDWADAKREVYWSLVHPSNDLDREVFYFPTAPEELSNLIAQAVHGALPPKGTVEARHKRFSQQSR